MFDYYVSCVIRSFHFQFTTKMKCCLSFFCQFDSDFLSKIIHAASFADLFTFEERSALRTRLNDVTIHLLRTTAHTTQVNSAFRAFWLANSEVYSRYYSLLLWWIIVNYSNLIDVSKDADWNTTYLSDNVKGAASRLNGLKNLA